MGVLMSLLKQAKTLSKRQITLTTALVQQTRYPARNLAIFLLSIKAGLRAKEIASYLGHADRCGRQLGISAASS